MESEKIFREDEKPGRPSSPVRVGKWILNGCIFLALLAAAYFAYAYISRGSAGPHEGGSASAQPPRILQLDVLNGCGARGIASKFTTFLRSAGFDVVEMKNYKVSSISKTLVVDRMGDLAAARRVAAALGVSEKNIIQQINPDYFVDVSIIIGADYPALKPLH